MVDWTASAAVRMHLNERATGDRLRDWLSAWAPRYFAGHSLRVLMLGGGEGVADWPFVEQVDAVDLADETVLPEDAYDVVVANMALHRIERLETALAQVERAMKPDATLIVNEYTGPKQFQYADDLLSIMNALRSALGRDPVVPPTDPSEAPRSDELLPMLFNRFEVLEEKRLGGTLLQHVLHDLAPERSVTDLLCTFEGALVDAQAIPSHFNIVAARKRGSKVRPVNRPLPPRPSAAKDVDPDPLRMRSRWRNPPQQPGTLQPWHLRLLRIALASTQPRRATLFEEQPMHSAMERFRFAVGNTSAFDWIASRYRAYGDDPVILALLATFDTLAPQ